MTGTMLAAKIHDDHRRIHHYSEQLLKLVKKEFSLRKIDKYDYERFINILTCLSLQSDEIRQDLSELIRLQIDNSIHIDVRV
ncbi:hypothetical protein V4V35_25460 [Bacillus infantis]|uniref:hypothetical protein n=1 Tax=Bacillus infantis TaxID=324767 RepID=UPI002FBD7980